ncbi:MAG TPA: hypothetical protein VGF75_06220 [Candidatus Saccharimonadales bacterium]|jgi:hypothetical protein
MGVDKTKEEWARRHLLQMGNDEPTSVSINFYVDLITPGTVGYDPFFERQYKRWVKRDEVQAALEYDKKSAEAMTKTLNEQYITAENNTGPFYDSTDTGKN